MPCSKFQSIERCCRSTQAKVYIIIAVTYRVFCQLWRAVLVIPLISFPQDSSSSSLDISGYGHTEVDRFDILLDLWTNEACYLENKKLVSSQLIGGSIQCYRLCTRTRIINLILLRVCAFVYKLLYSCTTHTCACKEQISKDCRMILEIRCTEKYVNSLILY